MVVFICCGCTEGAEGVKQGALGALASSSLPLKEFGRRFTWRPSDQRGSRWSAFNHARFLFFFPPSVSHHVSIALCLRWGDGWPGRLLVVSAGAGGGQRELDAGRRAEAVSADSAGPGDPHGADVSGRSDRYTLQRRQSAFIWYLVLLFSTDKTSVIRSVCPHSEAINT